MEYFQNFASATIKFLVTEEVFNHQAQTTQKSKLMNTFTSW